MGTQKVRRTDRIISYFFACWGYTQKAGLYGGAVLRFNLSHLAIFRPVRFFSSPGCHGTASYLWMSKPIKDLSQFHSPSCRRESHQEKLCVFLRVVIVFNIITWYWGCGDEMPESAGCLAVLIPSMGLLSQQEDSSGSIKPWEDLGFVWGRGSVSGHLLCNLESPWILRRENSSYLYCGCDCECTIH